MSSTALPGQSSRRPIFARGSRGLRSLLLVIVAIALFAEDQRHSPTLAAARQWAAWVLQPLIWFSSLPGEGADAVDHFEGREALTADNRALRARLLQQDGLLLRLQALEAENVRIRALLSSKDTLNDRVLIAEILQISQDPYRHQILLNKGAHDGVYRGQALVDSYGVLGQVIQVNPTTAVGLLINDPDHGIPVELNRTGLQTIAVGRGDGQALSLPFLPGNADIKVGDLLVSSALGGRFPAGYPVGQVFELRHPAGENFMEALAYPSAHLNQGRQVLLVWSQTPADTKDIQLTPLPQRSIPRLPPAPPPSTREAAPHR